MKILIFLLTICIATGHYKNNKNSTFWNQIDDHRKGKRENAEIAFELS